MRREPGARLRKALDDIFPKTSLLAFAKTWLWSNRALKMGLLKGGGRPSASCGSLFRQRTGDKLDYRAQGLLYYTTDAHRMRGRVIESTRSSD